MHVCMAEPRLLPVACAIIADRNGLVLVAQRPEHKHLGLKWEFPGGKLDPGERPERALARELREELGVEVCEPCLAPLTFASFPYPDFHLLMPLYVCRRWEGLVEAREHADLKWVKPGKLRDYPMPPADEPLIPALVDLLGA